MSPDNKKSELFDIVDKNNVPMGITKERALVHRDGDWHNTVHIYIFNDKDELLVHLRASFKDLHPNCWDTRFGGHVLAGETIEDAVVKEIKEEIGIEAKKDDFVKGFIRKWDGGANREFNNVYYYKWREQNVLKFDDGEVVDVKWMSKDKILNALKQNPEKWTTRENTVLKVFDEWSKLKS